MQSYWMQMTDTETVLDLRDDAGARAGPGQLLVRMHAAAPEPRRVRAGPWPARQGRHRKAIGGEGAGEVVAVGADVTGFKPGDRVMGRCPGAFSEYALMEAGRGHRRAAGLSWEEAASIPLTFLVVLRHAGAAGPAQGRRVAADHRRLVGRRRGLAAAGRRSLGAKVIGTSGSAAKLERLKPLGLDLALCTRAADFAPR